jgi:tRNA pseudouridine13 synthase
VTPRAYGPATLTARFRASPEDFVVEERAGFAPSGAGEHLLLTIEKRGLTTPQVARRLAAWAGVPEADVGYAGLKDKFAVTRQRFSVRIPKKVAPDVSLLQSDDVRVLEHAWHARKLPRGALAGNAFELVLRDVVADRAAVEARLEAIRAGGLPNYFGEQRFGRSGDNVAQARALFAGKRFRRDERSVLISAARSELFNAVLAARVADGRWADGVDGEVWMLDGTHSVFGPEALTDELRGRAARLDIHPTGPMWGRGELRTAAAALAIERAALEPFADLRAGLEAEGLRQERRALRVRVAELAWQWLDAGTLKLAFALPAGSYATGVLGELGDCSADPM